MNLLRCVTHLFLVSILVVGTTAAPAEEGGGKEIDVFVGEVNARIAELSADKVSPAGDVATLYDSMREVDSELAGYKLRADRILRAGNARVDVAEARREAVEVISNIATMDCRSASPDIVQSYVASLHRLRGSITYAAIDRKLSGDRGGRQEDTGLDGATTCKSLQDLMAEAGRRDALLGALDKIDEEQARDAQRRDQCEIQVEKLQGLLQARKWAIQTVISGKTSQQQLSGALWKVITVIGLFSIATILAIKLFDMKLQFEWIATGQVIQFVTVMILLSVLMALGLSGVLEQNTLGALLGSVAGHVLAQGVGKAAAREGRRRGGAAGE